MSSVLSRVEFDEVIKLLNATVRAPVATLVLILIPVLLVLPGAGVVVAFLPMPTWSVAVMFAGAGALCAALIALFVLILWRGNRDSRRKLEAAVELLNDEFGRRRVRWYLRTATPGTTAPAINSSDHEYGGKKPSSYFKKPTTWVEVEAHLTRTSVVLSGPAAASSGASTSPASSSHSSGSFEEKSPLLK